MGIEQGVRVFEININILMECPEREKWCKCQWRAVDSSMGTLAWGSYSPVFQGWDLRMDTVTLLDNCLSQRNCAEIEYGIEVIRRFAWASPILMP